MSAMTRPTDVLRNELQAFAPVTGAQQYAVFFRWAPRNVSNLSGTDWEVLTVTSQHDLASAIAELYGSLGTETHHLDTLVKQL